MLDIALDPDEREKRTILQGAQGPQTWGMAPIEPLTTKPTGDSYTSRIAKAESPILAKPNPMFRLLEIQRFDEEELALKKLENFKGVAANSNARIEQKEKEREEAFAKEIEANKGSDTWGMVANVAQYIAVVAAATMAVSVGGVAGVLLGAAAVAGGSVRLLNDTHLMQPVLEWFHKSHELQMELKREIETYALYLQVGCLIGGGFAAWQAGYFAALEMGAVGAVEKTAAALAAASTVMNVGGKVGQAYYGKRIQDFGAEGRILDQEIAEQRQKITHGSKDIQEMMEDMESRDKSIQSAIKKQQVL